MYGCESWTVKKAECQGIDAFELWCWRRTPESPLDNKVIKPINLKGNQCWIFTGSIDAEAEAPVFWSSGANRWLIGKVPDGGKDGGQEKRASENEMAGQHHWCNEHELGQTPGDGEGQGSLMCCSLWGHKELDMTGRLNNNNMLNLGEFQLSGLIISYQALVSQSQPIACYHLLELHSSGSPPEYFYLAYYIF